MKKKLIDRKFFKELLKNFEYSEDNTSVWRRPNRGYNNIGVALADGIFLNYFGNSDTINLVIDRTKYWVKYMHDDEEYLCFQDNHLFEDKILHGYVFSRRCGAYQDAYRFFRDLDENYIPGPHYINGELVNAWQIAKKYPDMPF